MRSVSVHASRSYDVLIECGLLSRVGEIVADLLPAPRRVMIVTDDTVNDLYGDLVDMGLIMQGYDTTRFVFPHGEASKRSDTLLSIWNALAEKKMTRSDLILALGGGVVGDMAGFAAATYLRGIPFVQCPTTLLAMVDSSVGGKTGIDLDAGKNLCGAFYQPTAVICDPNALETLPPEILADGYAEVIKYGYINDPELLDMLMPPVLDEIDEIIARCVCAKRDLVEADEHDNGARQLLNLGHTAGHAIEACSNFEISHGSAVATGMMLIARAAATKGLCPMHVPLHVAALLDAYNLPIKCPFDAHTLAAVALSDKKRKGDTITLIVPESLGKSRLYPIPTTELADFFAAGLPSEGK